MTSDCSLTHGNKERESSDTRDESSTSEGAGACGGGSSASVSPTPSTSTASASTFSPESGCVARCCCLHRDTHNQPLLAATKRIQGSGKSKQARSVQVGWFKEYPWVSLCETRQRLVSFYCQCAEKGSS